MLSDELKNSARTLGEALRASPSVQKYLEIQAKCAADAEAIGLENKLMTLYHELLDRQQRGEILQHSEIDAFNSLKYELHQHPLIKERDAALYMVRQTYLEIADEINFPLGVEFAALALVGKI